ncbi:SDR family oxidoreductase [Deinococcus cellulosilyticus]|uniref:Nucleotide-diphosphate-sugar epimerase n=1 Tax=Deinococcus cellulosilyticus (strain DSM 18568 / NBRC 106333 / KACC 11606 / 5516J-15) TaxID=1223518 RepID=A0A511MZK9_DEIC1|nr:NAD(P)H-binding protein [Deinococcus cellulosilyticus]GEM45982.1 nucleotide-diphosphate-sugar epimerase [Deinococcus cellulosilyticus NBRC 106333 = KACC 11606]
MIRVLVTGGTGVLGRRVVDELRQKGALPRVLSRKMQNAGQGMEIAQGDLVANTGLQEALKDVDVVIHCAHNPQNARENTLATRNLMEAVRASGVKHVVLISIIGVDRMTFYPYYRAKWQDEQTVIQSGVPYTILRSAQFHDFVGFLIDTLSKIPLILLPRDLCFQPVQLEPVAEDLAHAALNPPAGRMRDLAGPEVLTLDQMIRSYLQAQGNHKKVYTFPLPLPFITVWKDLSRLDVSRKGETWHQWLSRQDRIANLYQKARG